VEALITASAGEFRAALPEGGVLLALDLGTQTIGTAFCDAGWRFASPGKTLKHWPHW
jgi:putative Holliday junction resolvase